MLNKGLLLGGKIKLYNIIRGSVSNVSLSYSPQTDIKAGTRVNITVNANSGYQNPWVTVSKNDGTGNVTVSGSGSNRYFTMPKNDVTITAGASVIPTYSVSGSSSGGGISFSKTSGIRAGETITVYLSPNSYHILSSLTSSPYVSFSGSGNTRTFTMPSSNVWVTATFVAQYTNTINVDYEYRRENPDEYGYYIGYRGPYLLAGSLSPNTFSGLTITNLYSHGYSWLDSWNNTHCYRLTYITFNNTPSFNSITLTRLDTGASVTMTKSSSNSKQFSSPKETDGGRVYPEKMFFKPADKNRNILIKLVAH